MKKHDAERLALSISNLIHHSIACFTVSDEKAEEWIALREAQFQKLIKLIEETIP